VGKDPWKVLLRRQRMLIKELRGKRCPLGFAVKVGELQCEECDKWKFRLEGRVNKYGIECAEEFCEILVTDSSASTVKEDIIVDFSGVKKVFKWILDEKEKNHIVTLGELYDKYGFGTGQTLFWCLTVKHGWVARGIDEKIIVIVSPSKIDEIYDIPKKHGRTQS